MREQRSPEGEKVLSGKPGTFPGQDAIHRKYFFDNEAGKGRVARKFGSR